MDKFKFEAFLEEFPFLKEIRLRDGRYEEVSIQVARMSPELLQLGRASEHSYSWSGGERADGNRLFLCYKDGVVELPQGGDSLSGRQHDPQLRDIPSPSLLEYLDTSRELEAVVETTYDYCSWEGKDEGLKVTVFKPSMKVDARTLVVQAKVQAAQNVAAEIKTALDE